MGSGEHDLAPVARCDVDAVLVDHPHVDGVGRLATRGEQLRSTVQPGDVVVGAQQGADRRDLGHAVELDEDRAEPVDQLAQPLG